MNILFTCAGRRHYLLQYFKEALKGDGKIIATDMQLSAPALILADEAFVVPSIYSNDYVESILKICISQKVNAVFSLNDLELPILSEARPEFEKIGVKLIISTSEVIDICFDKWKTFQFAKDLNLNVPKTYIDFETAVDAINNGIISFPLVVKPRWGSASIGIDFPENIEELKISYQLQKIRLERSILSEASQGDIEAAILIQEKMKGKEFGVDILNNFEGNSQQVYIKEKLAMRAGETDKSILKNIPELEEISFKLGNSLGHIGNLDCDFFEKDGKYYLLELNPRFGGGYPFSHNSGANYPAAIINWLNNKNEDFSNFERNYEKVMAKCDTIVSVLGI